MYDSLLFKTLHFLRSLMTKNFVRPDSGCMISNVKALVSTRYLKSKFFEQL